MIVLFLAEVLVNEPVKHLKHNEDTGMMSHKH